MDFFYKLVNFLIIFIAYFVFNKKIFSLPLVVLHISNRTYKLSEIRMFVHTKLFNILLNLDYIYHLE